MFFIDLNLHNRLSEGLLRVMWRTDAAHCKCAQVHIEKQDVALKALNSVGLQRQRAQPSHQDSKTSTVINNTGLLAITD